MGGTPKLQKLKSLWLRVGPRLGKVLKKLGKAIMRVLAAGLCCAILFACVTGGIMMSEFAKENEHGVIVRAALFDRMENIPLKIYRKLRDTLKRGDVGPEKELQQTLYR